MKTNSMTLNILLAVLVTKYDIMVCYIVFINDYIGSLSIVADGRHPCIEMLILHKNFIKS